MAFTFEEKQQIVTVLGLPPSDFPMASSKASALELLDSQQGTNFVEQAQILIEELVNDEAAIADAIKAGNLKTVDIQDEVSVTWLDSGSLGGSLDAIASKKKKLAKLLGIGISSTSSNNKTFNSVTLPNMVYP